MDFFSAQDDARRNTRWLVFFFLLAVAALIAITNVLVAAAVFFSGMAQPPTDPQQGLRQFADAFSWDRFGFIGLAVVSTIGVVILFKWAQLSAGGKAVAERLGGERIQPNTDDPNQQRCLNVVAEMALAAGMPVPPVYVLPRERGINAFAAGISPADAVIGVTQGSLQTFNREQLQGVIAHEFSHILNGDMRLNIRLAALLKGITFVGDVGEMILRGGTRRRYQDAHIKVSYHGIVLGLSLWLVGWLGGLFAGVIKAAVSRQREHLADASAVQFTRNPKGVADALKVIGGYIPGTIIVEVRANELAHIFFGQIASVLWYTFSTHPPLPERIRRIEPDWNGEFIRPPRVTSYQGEAEAGERDQREGDRRAAAATAAAVIAGSVLGAGAEAGVREAVADAEAVAATAAPPAADMTALVEQAQDPFGSNAIVYGLMVSSEPEVRERQLALLGEPGIRGLETTVRQLLPDLQQLPVQWRLPLLEASLPALKCMSPAQYRVFKDTLLKLARADTRIDLYEWCLYQVTRHYLDPEFIQVKPSKPRFRKPVHVRQAYRTVLSVLAWQGQDSAAAREAAFTRGAESVGLFDLKLQPLEDCGVMQFGKAVSQLADSYPLLKPRLLKGMLQCAAHDDELSAREREILVAVAAVMDCPVPADVRLASLTAGD